jgi:TolB protein
VQPVARLVAVWIFVLLAVVGGADSGDATRLATVETIVFVRLQNESRNDSHLRRVAPGGGPSRRLGHSTVGIGSPAVSPDGRFVAYESSVSGLPAIYVRRLSGGPSRTFVVTRRVGLGEPAWSPDGRRLAYTRAGSVWVASVDGRTRRRLTRAVLEDSHPSWSPDGRWIVFACDEPTQSDICIVRSTGGIRRHLTATVAFEFAPSWSPDGRLIAFTSDRDLGSGNYQLYVMRPDGSGQRQVLAENVTHQGAAWSPGGGRLAFARGTDESSEIYTVRLNGEGLLRLTRNDVFDGEPAWAVIPR